VLQAPSTVAAPAKTKMASSADAKPLRIYPSKRQTSSRSIP
jgi:hypothetical protein